MSATLLALASQAYTASGVSNNVSVAQLTELELNLVVTAVSGTTPSMTIFVEGQDDEGNWFTLYSPAAITATGDTEQSIGPALQTDVVVPPVVRLRWAITGTTPSFTFTASLIGR